MPLVAQDSVTKERIDITRFANPKEKLVGRHLVCPACNTNLGIVAGNLKVNHFRHKVTCSSDSSFETHPETAQHLQAKEYLADELRADLNELGDSQEQVKVELEVRLKEVRRQADILITYPFGSRIAHEIQLFPTNPKELEARTDDYLRAGIDTVWWFGERNNTAENNNWSKERFGCIYYIGFGEIEVDGKAAITLSLDNG